MKKILWIFIYMVVCVLISPAASLFPESIAFAGDTKARVEILNVEKGHSQLIDLPFKIKRVSVSDEEVADVLVISQEQLYINGKAMGSTKLTIWGNGGSVAKTYLVRVGHDLTQLKEILNKLLPNEQIEVHELEDAIILSGIVSSYSALNKAKAIAIAYTGSEKENKQVVEAGAITLNIKGNEKDKKDDAENVSVFVSKDKKDKEEKGQVVVLLEVTGQNQVLLKMRFAEVNRQALKRSNVNIHGIMPNPAEMYFYTLFDELTKLPDQQGVIQYSNQLNGVLGWNARGGHVTGFLDLLKQNGYAKILAEPNLVCVSGKKGSFLAGGEIPVPVPGKDYTVITWKEYGVLLDFKPEILTDGRIRLEVNPSVSELDYSAAVVTGGFNVPGLTTRKVSSELVLNNGQGFVIAGLLKEENIEDVSKFPVLGEIPIIGALFRSKSYQRKETDLIIEVVPQIIPAGESPKAVQVKPSFQIPGDNAFFLQNGFAGGDEKDAGMGLLNMEGEFGHEIRF